MKVDETLTMRSKLKLKSGLILLIGLACIACNRLGGNRADDVKELLAMHNQVLEAHRQNNVEMWNSLEAETLTVASGGMLTEVSLKDRLPSRRSYLRTTKFETYEDVRPPIIRVSDDGTLAWLFAQVEIKGERELGGKTVPFHDVWAWVELYERRNGKWLGTGNASNAYSVAGNRQ